MPNHTTFDGDVDGVELSLLDPTTVHPHPDNPRRTLGSIAELADSIAQVGLLEPIVVERRDQGGFQLINGHRRLAAATRAGLTQIPALVHPTGANRADQIIAMLTENLQRADLTPLEEGDSYQTLLDLDLTTTQIAQRLGRPKKRVTAAVKAAGLPDTVRDRILHGQLTLDDAARIHTFTGDPDALDRLDRAALAGPLALERAISEETIRKQVARQVTARTKQLRALGAKVMPEDEWSRLEDDPDALEFVYLDDVLAVPAASDPDLPHDFLQLTAREQDSAVQDLWIVRHEQTCPGNTLAIIGNDGRHPFVEVVCTSPDTHHADDTDGEASEGGDTRRPDTTQDTARRREQERKQQERRREQDLAERRIRLEAAQVARMRYLAEVAASDGADEIAREIIREKLEGYYLLKSRESWEVRRAKMFALLVLPNAPETTLDDDKARVDQVRAALQKLPLPQLVVLQDIAHHLIEDSQLARPESWIWSRPDITWFTILADRYGYELAPVEQHERDLATGATTQDLS